MKSTFFKVSITLLAVAFTGMVSPEARAQGNGCVPIPSGLVSWWAGENDLLDTVGGNHASSSSGVSFTAGKVGTGIVFSGAGSRVIIPNSISLDFGPGKNFSIETWVRTTSHTGDWGIMVLLDKRAGGGVGYVFYLDSGRLAMRWGNSIYVYLPFCAL